MKSCEVSASCGSADMVRVEQGVFSWYCSPPVRVSLMNRTAGKQTPRKPSRPHVRAKGGSERNVLGLKVGRAVWAKGILLNKRTAEKILEATGFLSCDVPAAGASRRAGRAILPAAVRG